MNKMIHWSLAAVVTLGIVGCEIPQAESLMEVNGTTNQVEYQSTKDKEPPVITIRGNSFLVITQGEQYEDAGATAYDTVDGELPIHTSGRVNTAKEGTYIITYSAEDRAGNVAQMIRTVKVVEQGRQKPDTEPPVIILNGNVEMHVLKGATFEDPGASAYDDVDGDVDVVVSGDVDTSRVGTYVVLYIARDRAGNKAQQVRKVRVVEPHNQVLDTKAPVITLEGDRVMQVALGDVWIDPGATAMDDIDGKIRVETKGEVDTSTAGTYQIIYIAKDRAGNSTSKIRKVIVVAPEEENTEDTPPPSTAQADVRKGPYVVYDGVASQMKVLWQLKSTQKCTIDWGIDSATTQEKSSGYNGHLHVYTIKNLTPATHYDYSVSCDKGSVGSGSFRTAPDSDAKDVNLFVYGDTRSNPRDHDRVVAQMMNTYKSDKSYQTLVLHTGDFVSHGERESDWDSQYFDKRYTHLHQFQSEIPIAGIRGNHEGDADLFIKYFPTKHAQGGYYYTFDYGPVQIIAIDQYKSYRKGSTQYKWLESVLKNSTKKWKVIFLHEPGWSAGGHHNNADVQNYIQPLAKKYGVSFVFSGHNHYYARADVNGVAHVTAGGGGAPLYQPRSGQPKIVKAKMVRHFCTISVKGNTLDFKVIDEKGNEVDRLTLNQ